MTTKTMRDLAGHALSNRYQLTTRLAGGGMGEVYRGHDLLLDRRVAVKLLHPSLAGDRELVNRFKAEARAAARLSHPNVVAVHDWGAEDDNTYYMVMEYVAGTDLREVLLTRKRLEPSQALGIAAAVCDALAAAHAVGLVHRDIKPENVLIGRDGTVKVADFGIAVVLDADLTMPGGRIPGTLRYLSPEQARGDDATFASDIWATGAVLHELLTGQAMSQGSPSELLRRRAVEPPQLPSSVDPDLPPQIDPLVSTACALDPADRYPDAGSMAHAIRDVARDLVAPDPLASLVEETTGDVRPPDSDPTSFVARRERGGTRRSLRRWGAAVVAILVLLGGYAAVSAIAAPDPVRVPSLEGMSRDRAVDRLQKVGLVLEVAGREADRDVPRGQIMSQIPANGMIDEGSTIEVVLSQGPPIVDVTLVTGMPLPSAKVRLRADGMVIGSISHRYDLQPAGTVVAQDPPEGAARWGTTIDLVVSKGPLPVQLPDVTGKSYAKAAAALEKTGFVPVRTEVFSEDAPKGEVIGTEPGAGANVPQGSEIQVLVSMGPEFKQVEMPDVRNMYVDDARAALEELNLRVTVRQSCDGNGTIVLDSDPIAGRIVHENDLVALFVC